MNLFRHIIFRWEKNNTVYELIELDERGKCEQIQPFCSLLHSQFKVNMNMSD